MTKEKKNGNFIQNMLKEYPWFVRLEMSVEEFWEEFHYFMYNVYFLHKGLKGYKSLYEQRKIDPNIVSNVPSGIRTLK